MNGKGGGEKKRTKWTQNEKILGEGASIPMGKLIRVRIGTLTTGILHR